MAKMLLTAGLIAALTLAAAPLAAQQSDPRPEDKIGPPQFGPAAPAKRCDPVAGPKRPGEIVVCGAKDDSEFRVKSSSQLDPDSKEALDDGQPHAPDFAESCKKNPKGACIRFGTTPVPAYMINFDELPDAPEGSDADKIAKGEKKAD